MIPARRPTVVLWGGRPAVDYYAGSPRDRARQRRLRAGEAFFRTALASMAATSRGLDRLGITAAEASRNLVRSGRAMQRAGAKARRA